MNINDYRFDFAWHSDVASVFEYIVFHSIEEQERIKGLLFERREKELPVESSFDVIVMGRHRQIEAVAVDKHFIFSKFDFVW